MFVIGTAGHVDHGKSSLIRALTGIDPDRLPEEKAREMTIDLGFAWLALGDGQEVGIVDVPGHERFIKNMIAGAGAVNAVLFVVAADDGWMPQSQEHLDILSLLDVKHGIIVLTKTDAVEADWPNLVEQEIRKNVANTFLADAPLAKVSSLKGEGLEELKQKIASILGEMEEPRDIGKPRLFIDRVFTMAGRGTVVTGTLTYGKLRLNQEVEILPGRIKARIRELQTHKKTIPEVLPGNRAAINLSGVEKEFLNRGDLVTVPGQDEVTSILYVNLKLLPQIQWSLKKQILLQVMLGTAEVLGTAILLDQKELQPGEDGLVEIRLKQPLVPRLGDRLILRLPGPQLTIGGGPVLDWSHSSKNIIKEKLAKILESRRELILPNLILSELEKQGFTKPNEIAKSSHFSSAEIQSEIKSLQDRGQIQKQGELLCLPATWQRLKDNILIQLRDFHKQFPYKPGLKGAELAGRLQAEPDLVQLVLEKLEEGKKVVTRQGYVALSSHQPQLTESLQKKLKTLLQKLEASPISPPSRPALLEEDQDYDLVVTYLIQTGQLLELRDGLLFRTSDFQIVQEKVKELIAQKGEVSVADVRQKLATTRKYAVPILEKLDQLGITKRKGDYRVLNEK